MLRKDSRGRTLKANESQRPDGLTSINILTATANLNICTVGR